MHFTIMQLLPFNNLCYLCLSVTLILLWVKALRYAKNTPYLWNAQPLIAYYVIILHSFTSQVKFSLENQTRNKVIFLYSTEGMEI